MKLQESVSEPVLASEPEMVVAEPAAPFAAVASRVPSRRLDFLRGAAAFYVLIGHARGHLFAGGSVIAASRELSWYDMVMLGLLQTTSMGTEAVILFFVMSGFAMAHSFSRSESAITFYKKRAVRIWPPYLVAVLLAFVIAAIILRSTVPNGVTAQVGQTPWGWLQALAMVFYMKVDTELTAQFWSLPQEVMFYLLCPILLASRNRIIVFFGVSILLTFVGALVVGVYDNPTVGGGVIYRHFFTLLIFFMSGALAYHFQQYIPTMGGRALLIIFCLSFVGIWFVKYQLFAGWNLVSSLLTAPLALLLIMNVPASLYDRKILNWGHFSYSLYIVHMQLIVLVSFLLARGWGLEQPQMTNYWAWLLVVPPVMFLGWIFYLLTEKNCNGILGMIRDRERRARHSTISEPVFH